VDVQVSDLIYFEVIAEDGETKVLYQLLPDSDPGDAYVYSDIYSVDQDHLLIRFVPRETSVAAILSNIHPSRGASVKVVDKNLLERNLGIISKDDRILVTSEDGFSSNIYLINVFEESIDPLILHTLTLEVNPDNAGTTTGDGVYAEGAAITLIAIPAQGYGFLNWTNQGGTVISSQANFIYIMPASNVTLTANFRSSELCIALDNCDLTFITGGNAEWFDQTIVSYDGTDAAQSGAITHGQHSWMETTIQEPGRLTFRWKVSSENYCDYLSFYINDVIQERISGDVNWQLKTYRLGEGINTLRWTYSKDWSVNIGMDCGWVDQVIFIHLDDLTTYRLTIENNPENGGLIIGENQYEAGEEVTLTAAPIPGYAFVNWSGQGGNIISNQASFVYTMPSANTTLTANFRLVELCEALDNCDLTFTTGGDAGWFDQTVETHDGIDAAQSGTITQNQQSWMETTIEGPGRISFWWQTSSWYYEDFLTFYINGVAQDSISGWENWHLKDYPLNEGTNILRWSFSNNSGWSTYGLVDQLIFYETIELCEAVDNCELTFTTGGDADWFGRGLDGIDVAQSGTINNYQQTWMETTIEEPGKLTFRWKVSAMYNDYLSFYINDVLQHTISGNVNWQLKQYRLEEGTNTLRWTYSKNWSWNSGMDCGWVDEVAFVHLDDLTTYSLFIENNPENGGIIIDEGQYWEGEVVPLTATSTPGYSFVNWTNQGGTVISNQPGFVYTMPAEDVTLTANFRMVNLCEALDNCDFTFSTGGDAGWFDQTQQTYDGIDAAQSGPITQNQQSWMETAVEGPGRIGFWWRTESNYYDVLKFSINGVVQDSLSGWWEWCYKDYPLNEGTNIIRWSFSNNSGWNPLAWVDQLTFYDTVELCEALDNCDLTFTSGGDADWFGRTIAPFDGIDVAQSGAINNYQETWMETTIEGPGTLTFWWKLSANYYDYLSFYINDVLQHSISGDVDWQMKLYKLVQGTNKLLWTYSKDWSWSEGMDFGWVNQVVFTSDYYTLLIESLPEGAGTIEGAGSYEPGEEITITATPDEGYRFVNWTNQEGSEISNQASFVFTMPKRNITLTANFEEQRYSLQLLADPVEGGAVSGAGEFIKATEVTLSASPETGYEFDCWAGDTVYLQCAVSSETTIFMPSKDVVLTARFKLVTSTFKLDGNTIRVFPNPAFDKVNVHSLLEIKEIRITDLMGRVVYVDKPNNLNTVIATNYFGKGIYLINITTNAGSINKQLIIH
jgi:uncharacterized repeat protein (TIGR02543 family)